MICLLKPVEVKRWEWHGQAPSACKRRKHLHVTDDDALRMCKEGSARIEHINGLRCLVPLNVKAAYRPKMSDGFAVMQATDD